MSEVSVDSLPFAGEKIELSFEQKVDQAIAHKGLSSTISACIDSGWSAFKNHFPDLQESSDVKFEVLSYIVSNPANWNNLLEICHTGTWSTIVDAFYRHATNIYNYGRYLANQLTSFSKAVKPPVSIGELPFAVLLNSSKKSLDNHETLIRFIKFVADAAKDDAHPSNKLATWFVSNNFIKVEPDNGPAAKLLKTLVLYTKYIGVSRTVERLLKINEVARKTIFNNSYKGIFLLTPNPDGINLNGSGKKSLYVLNLYNSDSRHYLYRMQLRFLASDPYMPKIPSIGPNISRPGGSKSRNIKVQAFTCVKVPRLKRRTHEEYVAALIRRYEQVVSRHFLNKYGLIAKVSTSASIPVMNLSIRENQIAVVSAFRRSMGITSSGRVEEDTLKIQSYHALGNVPYLVFKRNGAIKEEYKTKTFIPLNIELTVPLQVLDMRNHVKDTSVVEKNVQSISSELATLQEQRSFSGHPLSRGTDVDYSAFPNRAIEEVFTPYLVDDETAAFLPYRLSRQNGNRRTAHHNDVSFGDGFLTSPILNTTDSLDPLNTLPVIMITEAILFASEDFNTMLSTLSRRIIRGGLKK